MRLGKNKKAASEAFHQIMPIFLFLLAAFVFLFLFFLVKIALGGHELISSSNYSIKSGL
jgi:hypothetical protein